METLNPDMSGLRSLPSVESLLTSEAGRSNTALYGRQLVLEATRHVLDEVRNNYNSDQPIPDQNTLLAQIHNLLEVWTLPTLRPVINASGVIIHTNLGRAPLSQAAIHSMQQVAAGYSSLEYDLEAGARGSRLVHAEALLQRLIGAEAALVVNNNAAAVLLALTVLARDSRVVISRSELVEIGGGFRVPEVMQQSGALLHEIGTTNRVHLADYRRALEAEPVPGVVMRAHRSNFKIIGFTSEPELSEIVALSHSYGVPVVDDLGSGSLLDTSVFGLGHEPMVQESLEAGADLVCFSGDKLLGGPQAGIILGRHELIARLKNHPLARAIRADKLCLAGLTSTLLHYLKGEAVEHVPVWRMIAATPQALAETARRWREVLQRGEIIPGESTVGGGSLPGETLPTTLLALELPNPTRFLERLRRQNPPVIARVEADRVLLDPRTVLPEQEIQLLAALQSALAER